MVKKDEALISINKLKDYLQDRVSDMHKPLNTLKNINEFLKTQEGSGRYQKIADTEGFIEGLEDLEKFIKICLI